MSEKGQRGEKDKGKGKERQREQDASMSTNPSFRRAAPPPSFTTTSATQPSQKKRKAPIFNPGEGFKVTKSSTTSTSGSSMTCSVSANGTAQVSQQQKRTTKVGVMTSKPLRRVMDFAIPTLPPPSLPPVFVPSQPLPSTSTTPASPSSSSPTLRHRPGPESASKKRPRSTPNPLPRAVSSQQSLRAVPLPPPLLPSQSTSTSIPSPPDTISAPPTKRYALDSALIDPKALLSNLFLNEYRLYGNPSYSQAYRKPFKPKSIPRETVRSNAKDRVSWDVEGRSVSNLAGKLLAREEFVGVVWVRDIVGTIEEEEEEGMDSAKGREMREYTTLDSARVYLVGKEFPTLKVRLVGYLVGVDERDEKVTYYLDDSTAVIECICTLPSSRPFLPPKPRPEIYEKEGGFKNKEKKLEEPALLTTPFIFGVGTLVQVVGRITDGMFAWASRNVAVDRIEELRDSNSELEHHHLVAQLHWEVYSKPYDLVARMTQLDEVERAEEAKWEKASVATSEAGSPRKKRPKRLAHPGSLAPENLNLSNFIVYIHNFLRTHHLSHSSSSRPASSTRTSCAPWDISRDHLFDIETATSFTLDDLAGNKRLKRFADLMAQQNEVKRRQRKKIKVVPFEPKQWIATPPNGLQHKDVPGWQGGSGTIVAPPPPSGTSYSASTQRNSKISGPLDEEALETAARRLFIEGLRHMRREGTIVICDPYEEDEPGEVSTVEFLDLEISPRKTPKDEVIFEVPEARSKPSGLAPWGDLKFADDDMETPKAKKTKPLKKAEEYDPAPWPLRFADEDEEGTPQAANAGRVSLFADRHAARASAASLQHKSKPSKTTRPPSPSSISNASWTTSMREIDTESFKLVTATTLKPLILRIIKKEMKSGRPSSDCARKVKPVKGVSEETVRKILAVDSKWDAVARKSDVVGKALEELVELKSLDLIDKLYSVG